MHIIARRVAASLPAQSGRLTSNTSQGLSSDFTRRYASHGAPQYNEPSGYLWGEKPLPPGKKRKREDWELIWYVGMYGSLLVAAIGLYFKPDTSIQTWALAEAKRRMEERGEATEYKPQS